MEVTRPQAGGGGMDMIESFELAVEQRNKRAAFAQSGHSHEPRASD